MSPAQTLANFLDPVREDFVFWVPKVGVSCEMPLKKSKNTQRESAVLAQTDDTYNENSDFGTHQRIQRIQRIVRKRYRQRQVRPSSHTRRGPI